MPKIPLVRATRVALRSVCGPAAVFAYTSVYASVYTSVYTSMAVGPTPVARGSHAAISDSVRALTFAWAAVNLALQPPYDTVQLQALPRSAAGDVVSGGDPVRYMTPDTSAISVSATGLVTAHQPTPLAHVIASVTQRGRTIVDTAVIQVTEQPFPGTLATLSIQPQSGGITSAHGNLNNTDYNFGLSGLIPFSATIAKPHADPHLAAYRICSPQQGCPKYPLLVHFASSDSTIAYVDHDGTFHPFRVGRVTLTASTMAYGVRKIDSLPLSVGYNLRASYGVYVDSTHGSPVLALRSETASVHWMPPYSMGLHFYLQNHTSEPVEVRLPRPAHGIYFTQWNGMHDVPRSTSVDTLTTHPNANIVLVLDSARTYVITYRGLTTGAIHRDTITTLPYP